MVPIKYKNVIKNATAYKWFSSENFFKDDSLKLLRDLTLNGDSFSTIIEEYNVESAGEAVPAGHVDCRHPFMTLNINRTMCHFSNRLGFKSILNFLLNIFL